VRGGSAGCQALFDEVRARELSDFRFGRLQRLTVDVYSLQHPAQYMRSGKSFAAHLTGMYAVLETEHAAAVNQAVLRWLDGPKALVRPDAPAPAERGELTICDVYGAGDADEHLRRIRAWAASTWAAWRAYHELARQWATAAMEH
jgi:hypothetical protein